MVMQAYAVVMVAKNKGSVSALSPETLEQDFRTEDLRKRIYGSSLTPAQLIIAENDERAESNTDHLMSTILCPHKGYEDHASRVTDISKNIEKYFQLLNSGRKEEEFGFYLIGGWIFLQRAGLPFVKEKLIAQSSIGKNKEEATSDFLKRFDSHMSMKYSLRLGHALRCRHISVQELMGQYVFQTPCSAYH